MYFWINPVYKKDAVSLSLRPFLCIFILLYTLSLFLSASFPERLNFYSTFGILSSQHLEVRVLYGLQHPFISQVFLLFWHNIFYTLSGILSASLHFFLFLWIHFQFYYSKWPIFSTLEHCFHLELVLKCILSHCQSCHPSLIGEKTTPSAKFFLMPVKRQFRMYLYFFRLIVLDDEFVSLRHFWTNLDPIKILLQVLWKGENLSKTTQKLRSKTKERSKIEK